MFDQPDRSAEELHDILVVGASAGGLEPLTQLLGGLPADLPAAVFVVVHIPSTVRSVLPEIFSRAGPLPAAHAVNGEPIRHGRIYVAPPDRHLLIEPDRVCLSGGPRENFSRPAVDTLFRSAAVTYGPRVIGVVLSGTLRDGTAGLWEVTQRGGVAVVQDPGEAAYAAMPHTAMDQVPVDYVVSASEMAALLVRLVGTRTPGRDRGRVGEAPDGEEGAEEEECADERPGSEAVGSDMAAQVSGRRDGDISVYICPECGGSLWQVNAGRIARFRCHVGHFYSAQDLLGGYTENTERALWTAIRTLRDRANLMRQLADSANGQDTLEKAAWYETRARLDDNHATSIERMLDAAEAASH